MNKSSNQWLLFGLVAGAFGGLLAQLQRSATTRQWSGAQWRNGPGRALITGASAGIGAEFARQLARAGYHLVLTARREERLRTLAEEIQARFPVQVEVLPADLDEPRDLERLEERIRALDDLTLLVNNAGFGAGGGFARNPAKPELKMIRVHVLASVRLARAVLPGMLDRGHGAIINVSSMAGFVPMPGSATYGATKAYLNSFSETLRVELAGSGVRVQALCPGMTHTELHQAAGLREARIPRIAWMTAEYVVAESLKGLRENRTVVVPGLLYKILYLVANSLLGARLIRLGMEMGIVRRVIDNTRGGDKQAEVTG